jgi:hypothetical protein
MQYDSIEVLLHIFPSVQAEYFQNVSKVVHARAHRLNEILKYGRFYKDM